MYEVGTVASIKGTTVSGSRVNSKWPTTAVNGRTYIWGCLTTTCVTETTTNNPATTITSKLQNFDFDNAAPDPDGTGSLRDWHNNTKKVFTNTAKSYFPYPWWSEIPGETNIIYALNTTDGYLVKINVDTGVETRIYSYNVSANRYAGIVGFAKHAGVPDDPNKNILIIDLDISGTSLDRGDAIKVNVVTGVASAVFQIPGLCSQDRDWYPTDMGHHHATSPNGKYNVVYGEPNFGPAFEGQTFKAGVIKAGGSYCSGATEFWTDPNHATAGAYKWTHMDWNTADDWYMVSNGGDLYLPGNYVGYLLPRIDKARIWQVSFDETNVPVDPNNHTCPTCYTANLLIDKPSAGYYYWNDVANYGLQPMPTVQWPFLHFPATNGKYSITDKLVCDQQYENVPSDFHGVNYKANCDRIRDSNPNADDYWEGAGIYVAELAYSDTSVCTSFTYSDWGECQSNNTQTRTVTASSPSGCTSGTPVLAQSCTYGSSALTILKTTSAPTIDGNLTEYNNANSISFSPASGGNTVTVKPLWTSEALYLGVNVTDTQLNASATTRDGSVWSEDSIEWFIDTYYDGGGSSNPDSDFMRVDDYQGIVSILNTKYDSQGTTSGTPSSSWNGTWQSAVKLSGTANTTDTDTGYSIEIKIPWTSIGYSTAPSSDALVGMSFAVNDKDSGGTYSKMWLSSAGSNQNASNWQRILLSGQNNPADINNDSYVNIEDFKILLSQWLLAGSADLNSDNIVNSGDLGIMMSNWNN